MTFTVRATNRGPSPATAVALTDALPAGLSFVSATASQGSYDQVTGIWTVGALDAAAQATLTLVATVDQAGTLVNNARVTAQAEADPNPLNNSDAVLVNAALAAADLSVTKASSQTTPGLGALVSYTIAVTNLGPDDATSAVIGDPLPAGVVFESASASQGSYDAGTGDWTVGALPVTRTATLTLTGRVTQTGPLVNTATRLSSAPVDPNPANDAASATLTASIVADVSVVKTPSAPTVAAGAPLAWTITVANSGPSTAAGVSVTDAFPPAFTGVTWTCTATAGSACALPSGAGAIGTTVDLCGGRQRDVRGERRRRPDVRREPRQHGERGGRQRDHRPESRQQQRVEHGGGGAAGRRAAHEHGSGVGERRGAPSSTSAPSSMPGRRRPTGPRCSSSTRAGG